MSYFPYNNQEAESAEEWQVAIYTDRPDEAIKLINNIRKQFNLPNSTISTTEIENKDWVTEVQKNFKPITVENIYIYSSYYKSSVSTQTESSICINIDPGNAFGTGEHHTTKGCLKALSNLSKTNQFSNIIDMGCGSAILTIAAAKLFKKAKILATDIDDDAITVAQDNVIKNNVENHISLESADGINNNKIKQLAPFDLIVCNILSSVLIKIAKDIREISTKDTIIVLSGLTIRQLDAVTNIYTQYRYPRVNPWSYSSYSSSS